MKDRFNRSILAGLLAGFIMLLFSFSFYILGISRVSVVQIGATIFIDPRFDRSIWSAILGLASHLTYSAIYGVLYQIVRTGWGDDAPVVKGLAVGAITWLAAGVFARLMGIHLLTATDSTTSLIWLLTHLIFGLSLSFFVARLEKG